MVKLTRLRTVRERAALTMEQLEAKSGVSKMTIFRIENGKVEPYPTTTRKLADALGVAPHELMEPHD